jgi:hypothetical protein
MGIFGMILGLPLVPIRGAIRLAEIVRDEAERELSDPSAVIRQLEAVAEARTSGQLSAEEAARLEDEAVQRLIWQPESIAAQDWLPESAPPGEIPGFRGGATIREDPRSG